MVRTKEQLVEEIAVLEIECSRIMAEADGKILGSNLFPKYLKLSRKVQKLRDKL